MLTVLRRRQEMFSGPLQRQQIMTLTTWRLRRQWPATDDTKFASGRNAARALRRASTT